MEGESAEERGEGGRRRKRHRREAHTRENTARGTAREGWGRERWRNRRRGPHLFQDKFEVTSYSFPAVQCPLEFWTAAAHGFPGRVCARVNDGLRG